MSAKKTSSKKVAVPPSKQPPAKKKTKRPAETLKPNPAGNKDNLPQEQAAG